MQQCELPHTSSALNLKEAALRAILGQSPPAFNSVTTQEQIKDHPTHQAIVHITNKINEMARGPIKILKFNGLDTSDIYFEDDDKSVTYSDLTDDRTDHEDLEESIEDEDEEAPATEGELSALLEEVEDLLASC